MTTVSTPAEVLLCREGEPASSMNVLAAGRAKSFTVGAEGKEVIHSLLAPGDLFGAHALLGRTDPSSSVQALTDHCVMRLEFHYHHCLIIRLTDVAMRELAEL